MSKYCIVTPDIDQILQQTLDPRSIWTMCQVNKHYNELWEHLGFQVAETKLTLDQSVMKGYLWIFKWIFEKKYKNSLRPREIIDFHEYYQEKALNILEQTRWSSHDEDIIWDDSDLLERLANQSDSSDDEEWAQVYPKGTWDVVKMQREIIFHAKLQTLFEDSLLHGHTNIPEYLLGIANKYLYQIDLHSYVGCHRSQLFGIVCSEGHLNAAQWLLKLEGNTYGQKCPHFDRDVAFMYTCCKSGNIDILKWLIGLENNPSGKIDIHSNKEFAFKSVCRNGNLAVFNYLIELSNNSYGKFHISKEAIRSLMLEYNADRKEMFDCLVSLGYNIDIHFEDDFLWRQSIIDNTQWSSVLLEMGEKSHGLINIHVDNEDVFRILCKRSRTESIKELIKLGEGLYGPINIHADREAGFRHACRSGNLELAQYLIELGEGTYGIIDIHAVSDEAYHHAAQAKHTHILRYLESLSQTYGPIPDKIRKKYQNVK